MRPIRLAVEGFRSYRERAVFEFEGRDLVGVVGPTGSGKSTILDALTFALYGQTPAVGSAVTRLVNGRSETAQVELWFALGDETFRVVRRLGKTSAQSLERWDGVDGTKLETITDKAREIGAWVEARSGLDFDTFTRAVLLAQNRFMAMLAAPPAAAAAVLTGLFGFGVIEHMRKEVGGRLTDVRAELLAAREAADAHAQRVGALEEAKASQATAEGAAAALDSVRPQLLEVIEQVEAAVEAAQAHRAALEELETAGSGLPEDDELGKVVSAAVDHERLLAAAVAAESDARAKLTDADAALTEAMADDLAGAINRLETILAASKDADRRLEVAADGVTNAEAGLEGALAARSLADERATDATTAEAEAQTAADEAAAVVDAAEAAHAAHVLAEGLEPGDPCPVCHRALEAAPEVDVPDDLETVRAAARLAAERAASASTSLQAEATAQAVAAAKVAQAEATLAERSEDKEEAERRAAAARSQVAEATEVLDADGDPATVLDAAKARWAAIGEARATAAAAAERATVARTALEATDALAGFGQLVAAHGQVAAVLGLPAPDPVEPSGALEALAPIREGWVERLAAARRAVETARAKQVEAEQARSSVLALVDVVSVEAYEQARAAASAEVAAARGRTDVLAEQVSAGAAALERVEQASARALSLERLHADLAPGKFPQFLLDEKRRELTAAGSEWLRGLSRGRYEFVLEDKRFRIRELSAAGLVRDAATLSGGETFLASLALALGLATMVGMEGGSLDAFFIDEGFGSLDAESLDLAMDGIEQLVTGEDGRLVVVVSHVPELRERIEDLIVLGKDEVTGETVVVRS